MRLSPLDPLGRAFTMGLALAHFAAARYEEAVQWLDRTLGEEPRHRPAMRVKAVCYAYLGRMEEARDGRIGCSNLTPGSRLPGSKHPRRPFHRKSWPCTWKVCSTPGCPNNECDPPSRCNFGR